MNPTITRSRFKYVCCVLKRGHMQKLKCIIKFIFNFVTEIRDSIPIYPLRVKSGQV